MNIWKAVEQEDLAAIEAYANKGGDLEVGKSFYCKTPLLYALQLKRRKSYEALLALGASPNTQCRGGDVPIHVAAYEGPYWLELALKHGGDPNLMKQAEGLRQGTPIYYALGGTGHPGQVESVRLLLDHGADIDARINRRGDTALAQACKVREFEIVHLLLERGAMVDEAGPRDESFIITIRDMRIEDFQHMNRPPGEEKWCKAVWEWLRAHDLDPDKAEWTGEKWAWKKD